MEQEKKKSVTKGCIIAAIVAAVVCFFVIIGILMCGILSSIAIPVFLKSANRAKNNIVSVNSREAYLTIQSYWLVKGMDPDKAIQRTIEDLNNANTPGDTSDDARSPYAMSLPAYGTSPAPGMVVIKKTGNHTIEIIGYDKQLNEIAKLKVIKNQQE